MAEYLRTLAVDQRLSKLKEMILKVNDHLPNNVYIPMKNFNGHRVLKISLDHAMILHSNEKAPFHILIEVENISFSNMQGSLIHELEETKRQNTLMNESLVTETAHSGESVEDGDEMASLRLSNENNPYATHEDSDNSTDENQVNPFIDHYAEDLLEVDNMATNKLNVKINPKRYEESKIFMHGDSADNESTDASSNFEYQLARVTKRKPSMWRRVFTCQCEDEEEIVPIVNSELQDLDQHRGIHHTGGKINPIGLFGKKTFDQVKEETRCDSEHGHLEQWDLISVIVKSGENIQQEKLASLLMRKFQDIFAKAKIK
jgi:hypothetical protein